MRLMVKSCKTRKKNYATRVFRLVNLGIESLEVDPIARILQEAVVRVGEEVLPLAETSMDDIRAIPHGFKLPFSSLIMDLVIDDNKVPLVKTVWVDVGVIMGL